MEVYVARQPIFNKDKEIFGYELLFRESMSNFFPDIDGNTATSKLLHNSFFTIGIEEITGSKLAFINFTQELLINRMPLMFPRERVVVEILEDVEPQEDVVTACQEIAKRGYSIAMDDFFYKSELDPLIALTNIIKFDLRATSFEEMEGYVKNLANGDLRFLAEKVETHDEFNRALKIGCHYFQGYFFSKPEILKGRDFSGAQMNLLEIMTEANKENFSFQNLEKVIARDVAISYKLLKFINSAFYRRVKKISSIKQAIVFLGEREIRRFVSLVAMAKLSTEKPDELIRSSVVRAKFCELVGESNGSNANSSELFTLGLFSLIDAILDDSMENLMEKIPLSDSIKQALVYGEGELINYLRLAVSYQTGDWGGVSETATMLGLDEEELPKYFIKALGWADSLTGI